MANEAIVHHIQKQSLMKQKTTHEHNKKIPKVYQLDTKNFPYRFICTETSNYCKKHHLFNQIGFSILSDKIQNYLIALSLLKLHIELITLLKRDLLFKKNMTSSLPT